MKKIIFIITILFIFSMNTFGQALARPNTDKITSVQDKLELNAFTEYPVPLTGNFLERKLIYDWTLRWNVPDTVCYVYIETVKSFL